MDLDEAARAFREFVAVIKALRTPETGCPWDMEQDHQTLRRYLVEESQEVLDAIDGGSDPDLCEELGDLLLQVVLHAQVADDRGAFAITDVVRGITAKMIRRHPHVFGSVRVSNAAEVVQNWKRIKEAERKGEAMTEAREYVLGQSERAARRLAIQDAHFAEVSELLLDDLALRPQDRVVELGCGPGSFSRRILKRLGPGGILVGVDSSEGLLKQAQAALAGQGAARFEPVQADLAGLGPWLDGADVVVGRTVLHHVPMAEFVLGRLRARVRPGTRIGFLEPDFRTLLARLTYLEATGRTELAPMRVWATCINQLYNANRISPDVGATLGPALEAAGYRRVRSTWRECAADAESLENMSMFYDEVRDRLDALGILPASAVAEQQRLLAALSPAGLPAVWGIFRVTAET